MRLAEIKRILSEEQLRLTKSMGQNFLHDQNQLQRIVDAAELTDSDQVLEIGPGLGSLTDYLLAKGSTVLAIEKDRRLFEFLQRRFEKQLRLTVIHADAVQFLRENPRHWTNWKCVSNLPYSSGSPILVELALNANCPKRMVVTLQSEVARRLRADTGRQDYGLLTLLTQLNFEPAGCFRIPPSCFFPAPKVDSSCVTMIRKDSTHLTPNEIQTFRIIVKKCFSQRRKMMINLLKMDWKSEWIEDIYRRLSLSQKVRAEGVSLVQFIRITQYLSELDLRNR